MTGILEQAINDLLINNAATASQNTSLTDDPITREAIKLNIIDPLRAALSPKPAQDVTPVYWRFRYIGTEDWIYQKVYPSASNTTIEREPLYGPDTIAKLVAERDALQSDLKHLRSMAGQSRGELETALTACQKQVAGLREALPEAWNRAHNAWMKHTRHFTKQAADDVAVLALAEALALNSEGA